MAMLEAIALAVLWLCLQTGPGLLSAPSVMMAMEVILAMLGFLISKMIIHGYSQVMTLMARRLVISLAIL